MNWDRVFEDWTDYAPIYRLDILSQACLEKTLVAQAIEFQKEIFHHKASTENEQSNAANLVAMSCLNLKSLDEKDRYIKALIISK